MNSIEYGHLCLGRRVGITRQDTLYIIDGNGKPIKIKLYKHCNPPQTGIRIIAPRRYRVVRSELLSQDEVNKLEKITENGYQKS